MDDRSRLRDEISVASALCLGPLADAPGAQVQQSLAAAAHLADTAERTLHLFVAEARATGMTWATIGEQLGITRQAAQKRFGGQVPLKVTRPQPDPSASQVAAAVGLLDAAAERRYEELEQRASAHIRRMAGSGGVARAFDAVPAVYGELTRAGPPQARLIGRVLHVSRIEERTGRATRAEITVAEDGTLLGLAYTETDAD